jgi:hypothetical protein
VSCLTNVASVSTGQTEGSKETLEETEEAMKNPETLATFVKQDTGHWTDCR